MKKVCIFIHYFPGDYIPFFVQLYVEELSNFFDEIIVVTNKRKINNADQISNAKVEIIEVDNEGYDMGMFYKAFNTLNVADYQTIACINDSNLLFGKLDFLFEWAAAQNIDYWGLADYGSETDENYHIQSHFLVFNKNAIDNLNDFFDTLNLNEYYLEKNPKILKSKIIKDWEIGLSKFLIKNKMRYNSYIVHDEYKERYKFNRTINISLKLYDKIIENGVPIIKRRIVNSTNLNHLLSLKWRRLIIKYSENSWDISRLIKELEQLRFNHLLKKLGI
jgi:lipopolysaccharide biosynthesis protein